jgi:hypothetical protein
MTESRGVEVRMTAEAAAQISARAERLLPRDEEWWW